MQQSFNAALDYLICNRNLETAYNTLKDLKYCNSMYNRRVLNKLFDRQNSILNNLKFVSDPLQRKTISDGLVLTASDVLCGYFNLFEIVGSNAENYATNVAWIYTFSFGYLSKGYCLTLFSFAKFFCRAETENGLPWPG